jgi:hypothetical protein
MERMFLNQTALSLGYIAMKRIRALEEHRVKRSASPLLLQLGHIKILAACVEQVGPDEIIEYQMNQDYAVPVHEPLESVFSDPCTTERHVAADDVANPPVILESSSRKTNRRKSLVAIPEDDEAVFCMSSEEKKEALTNPTDIEDEEYSMDDLYDEYNEMDDGWETDSEDGESKEAENIAPSPDYRLSSSVETDSDDEDDAPTPPSANISRSPPLNITKRHPITNELNKREQYRKEIELSNSELSRAFVEQIEDVLSHDFRCMSLQARMCMDSLKQRPVSLYA